MGKVIEFRMTEKSVYRAATREVKQAYQLSGGGADPVPLTDEASMEAFERGEIEEVRWMAWANYCEMVFDRIARLQPKASNQ